MANKTKEKEKEKKRTLQDETYYYIRDNIMSYNSDIKLPKHAAMRLKGLHNGQFYYNKKTKPMANYPWEVILATAKICQPKIMYAISRKTFKSEIQKFNYVLAIIENNINDVYLRMKQVKKEQEAIAKIRDDITIDNSSRYKKKTKKEAKNLSDLW